MHFKVFADGINHQVQLKLTAVNKVRDLNALYIPLYNPLEDPILEYSPIYPYSPWTFYSPI